jgi:uncharacterized protein (DUF3820 family)
MRMPMGKFEGRPVADMSTTYLVWLISNDHIRFKRWPLIQEALRILRGRFNNLDAIVAELKVESQPPAFWKSPEQIERRKAEKAEKLRQVEERREAERQQLRAERRARFLQQRVERMQVIDASYYRRKTHEKQVDPNDVSDLL